MLKKFKKKGKCRFKNGLLDGKRYNGTIYKLKSFIWVKQDDRLALMEVLDQYGPVSVSIDSSSPKFVSYSVGDFYWPSKTTKIGSKKLIKIINNYIIIFIFF